MRLFDSAKQHRHVLPAFEAAALRPRTRRRAEVVPRAPRGDNQGAWGDKQGTVRDTFKRFFAHASGAARDEEPH